MKPKLNFELCEFNGRVTIKQGLRSKKMEERERDRETQRSKKIVLIDLLVYRKINKKTCNKVNKKI